MDPLELFDTTKSDPRASETQHREAAVQTLGNMTILSSALNGAQSNMPWNQRRKETAKYSLLLFNQMVLHALVWNETTILARREDIFGRALKTWQR
jgi:hypothetical protein